MYYRSRPPRKRIYNYFLPFIIIGAIFAGVFYGWNYLNTKIVDQDKSTINEKVFLNIENGSAKAMTVGQEEWQNAPDKIYLYRGESLKTGSDGKATLTFFDQSLMRLNTDTEVSFASLKKNADSSNIEVKLKKGEIWSRIAPITNPNSSFAVSSDLVKLETRGSVFSFTYPGILYVLEGSVDATVKQQDKTLKTFNVGVGQQFIIDESAVQSLVRGDSVDAVFAVSDAFKESDWYRWNQKKDGEINAFEESGTPEDSSLESETVNTEGGDEAEVSTKETPTKTTDVQSGKLDGLVKVTDPAKDAETNKASVKLTGQYDTDSVKSVLINGIAATLSDGKWSSSSVKLVFEGSNKITIEAVDNTGVKATLTPYEIKLDTTAPEAPKITDPKSDSAGTNVSTMTEAEQIITGTVGKDVQAVIVNDYRLAKFVPGSGTFQYYAKFAYGNLLVGDNEFKIIAEDKAGNQSEPTTIVLKVSQSVIDGAKTEADSAASGEGAVGTSATVTNLPKATSTGGVKITSPNNGENLTTSDTEFEIAGTVPAGTEKVVVNDYPLSLFKAGDTSFKYRAYASIGNLKIGEKNSYTVTAYDADDKEIGTASIIIDVQSGSGASPVITIPSDSGKYTTSLDTIVIGGTIGKWVTHVYVNDKEASDYIPGSEKWRMSVKLNPGENVFVVSGEKDGTSVGKATITVTYKQ